MKRKVNAEIEYFLVHLLFVQGNNLLFDCNGS